MSKGHSVGSVVIAANPIGETLTCSAILPIQYILAGVQGFRITMTINGESRSTVTYVTKSHNQSGSTSFNELEANTEAIFTIKLSVNRHQVINAESMGYTLSAWENNRSDSIDAPAVDDGVDTKI